MRRITTAISSLLAACAFIVSMSCGIDTISYLSGNPRSYSVTDTALVFYGPDSPDGTYMGIDLFYRIYASEADADADLAGITARQSATNAVPGSSVTSYLLSASSLAYTKPLLDGSIEIPQVPTLTSDFAEIVFQSTPGPMTPEPTISFPSSSPSTYELRRSIGSGSSASFNAIPVSGDADFKSNSGDSDSVYYVQFFAASFGIDFSTGITELYGDAVYLGRMKISF